LREVRLGVEEKDDLDNETVDCASSGDRSRRLMKEERRNLGVEGNIPGTVVEIVNRKWLDNMNRKWLSNINSLLFASKPPAGEWNGSKSSFRIPGAWYWPARR
jgi:hypothetical protein